MDEKGIVKLAVVELHACTRLVLASSLVASWISSMFLKSNAVSKNFALHGTVFLAQRTEITNKLYNMPCKTLYHLLLHSTDN